MSRPPLWSHKARSDLKRLANFLVERDPRAARRMSRVLQDAGASLTQFPERAPLIDHEDGLRELRVKFGRYGYAIQYAVEGDVVLIVQLFHARENR